MNNEETHIAVQNDILLSRESELKAAEIFTASGYLVYVQFIKPQAKTLEDIESNSDFGDIIIFKPGGSNAVVEVKRLSSANAFAYFCEAKDFRNGIIVDRKQTYDKKFIKPVLYLTFNHPMSYFFLIECKNKEDWTVRKEYCVTTKKMEDYYVSKAIDCQFYETEDKLKTSP